MGDQSTNREDTAHGIVLGFFIVVVVVIGTLLLMGVELG